MLATAAGLGMAFRKNTVRQTLSRRLACVAALALVAGLGLASCAMTTEAPTSVTFDKSSDTAIVLLGTNVQWWDGYIGVGRSVASYWQEYDPRTKRLVPGGHTFWTDVSDTIWVKSDYRRPTIRVLEVAPGSYAMTAAAVTAPGLVQVSSAFVAMKTPGASGVRTKGHFIDPREHIAPSAAIDDQKNFVFSVPAGQIIYIGHFEFVRAHGNSDVIVDVNYSFDETAARTALAEYPAITGDMVTLNLALPTEQAVLP
jgi:hypothetical protein